MKITCLHTPNSKFGPFQIVYDLERWPAGTRKSRGFNNAGVVYQRDANADDIAEAKASYRFLCFRYKCWQGVINDEKRCGYDVLANLPDYKMDLYPCTCNGICNGEFS